MALRCTSSVLILGAFALPFALLGCGGLAKPPRSARAWHEMLPGLSKDSPPASALRIGDRIIVAVGDGSTAPAERATWIEGNGRAHVAAGQDVEVAGVTVERAEARVAAALRTRDRFAVVDIRIDDKTPQRAIVIGAVVSPGTALIGPAMRVGDLIAVAGGLTPSRVTEEGQILPSPADLGSAKLLRNGRALPVDMTRALLGAIGHNVYVHPGDILYIPYVETTGVSVLGQVLAPGVVPYHSRLRLTEALAVAGGLTSWGDGDDVRVIRGPSPTPVAYQASLDEIVDGESGDVNLLPGDIVFVQDEPLEDLFEVVSLVTPIAGIASTFLLTTILLSAQ